MFFFFSFYFIFLSEKVQNRSYLEKQAEIISFQSEQLSRKPHLQNSWHRFCSSVTNPNHQSPIKPNLHSNAQEEQKTIQQQSFTHGRKSQTYNLRTEKRSRTYKSTSHNLTTKRPRPHQKPHLRPRQRRAVRKPATNKHHQNGCVIVQPQFKSSKPEGRGNFFSFHVVMSFVDLRL